MRKFHFLAAAAALLLGPIRHRRRRRRPFPAPDQDEEQAAFAEFRAAIDELRAAMLQPGERVAGWDRGGADPDAELRALGADSHYFITRGETGVGVSILTDRRSRISRRGPGALPTATAPPASGWRAPQVDFVPVSDRYVMATRSQAGGRTTSAASATSATLCSMKCRARRRARTTRWCR